MWLKGVAVQLNKSSIKLIILLHHFCYSRIKSRSSKERERHSAIQYKFYLQLCLALLSMYIVFLAGINRTEHYIGCVVASVLLHYFALTSVLWMFAICSFLFWIMVVNPFAKANFNCCRMAIVTLICWGKPSYTSLLPGSAIYDKLWSIYGPHWDLLIKGMSPFHRGFYTTLLYVAGAEGFLIHFSTYIAGV